MQVQQRLGDDFQVGTRHGNRSAFELREPPFGESFRRGESVLLWPWVTAVGRNHRTCRTTRTCVESEESPDECWRRNSVRSGLCSPPGIPKNVLWPAIQRSFTIRESMLFSHLRRLYSCRKIRLRFGSFQRLGNVLWEHPVLFQLHANVTHGHGQRRETLDSSSFSNVFSRHRWPVLRCCISLSTHQLFEVIRPSCMLLMRSTDIGEWHDRLMRFVPHS